MHAAPTRVAARRSKPSEWIGIATLVRGRQRHLKHPQGGQHSCPAVRRSAGPRACPYSVNASRDVLSFIR